jgi:hypothetical protein
MKKYSFKTVFNESHTGKRPTQLVSVNYEKSQKLYGTGISAQNYVIPEKPENSKAEYNLNFNVESADCGDDKVTGSTHVRTHQGCCNSAYG